MVIHGNTVGTTMKRSIVNITTIDTSYKTFGDLPVTAENGTSLLVTGEKAIYSYDANLGVWKRTDVLRHKTAYVVLNGEKKGIYRYISEPPYLTPSAHPTPTKLSGFDNDAGYLVDEDLNPLREDIEAANATANAAKSVAEGISGIADSALVFANRALNESDKANAEIEKMQEELSASVDEASKQIEENLIPKITALESTKQDTISFDGKYDAESNKVATVETVIRKVAEIVAEAPDDFNTLKELSDWLTTHEGSAAEMNSAIKQNTDDISEIAEGLTNYVKKTDYASATQHGVVRAESWGEVTVDRNGTITATTAVESDIDTRYRHRLLRCSNLDYAIFAGITGKLSLDGGNTHTYGNHYPTSIEPKGVSAAHKWLGLYYEEDGAEYKATSYYLSAGYGHGFYGADTVGIATNSELGNLEAISIYELDKYEVTINKKDAYDPTKPIDEDKTYPLEEFEVNEVNGGYILALKGGHPRAYIYIVEDFAVFNSSYYTNFTFNGVYLGHSYNDTYDINGNMYSSYRDVKSIIAKNITPVPNRFLDLANHIDIKRLSNSIDNLSYDDLNDKPFYTELLPDTISMRWDGDQVPLTTGGNAYFQTDKTYTVEQLIGSTITVSSYGNTFEHNITRDFIKEVTYDGFYYSYGYAFIFVAYTDNYKPSICTTAFPKAGIYFGTDQYGDEFISSLTNIRTAKKLDNIFLDLANNSYLNSKLGDVEAALDSIISLQNSLIGGES